MMLHATTTLPNSTPGPRNGRVRVYGPGENMRRYGLRTRGSLPRAGATHLLCNNHANAAVIQNPSPQPRQRPRRLINTLSSPRFSDEFSNLARSRGRRPHNLQLPLRATPHPGSVLHRDLERNRPPACDGGVRSILPGCVVRV
jgi:hypothetical protein